MQYIDLILYLRPLFRIHHNGAVEIDEGSNIHISHLASYQLKISPENIIIFSPDSNRRAHELPCDTRGIRKEFLRTVRYKLSPYPGNLTKEEKNYS